MVEYTFSLLCTPSISTTSVVRPFRLPKDPPGAPVVVASTRTQSGSGSENKVKMEKNGPFFQTKILIVSENFVLFGFVVIFYYSVGGQAGHRFFFDSCLVSGRRPVSRLRLQVSWTPPASSGGIPLLGYKLYRRPSNGPVRLSVPVDMGRETKRLSLTCQCEPKQ